MRKAFWISMLVVGVVLLLGLTACDTAPVRPCKDKLPEELTEQDKQDCKDEAARKFIRNHYNAAFPPLYIPTIDPSQFHR